jgi:long-chain fatty acid transport protein
MLSPDYSRKMAGRATGVDMNGEGSMKHTGKALAALLMTTGMAQAGGIDRTGQRFAGFFEPGNYAELSFGAVSPSISGTDLPLGPYPGGGDSGNVAADFYSMGLMVKTDLDDHWSAAIVMDSPFGADILYGPGSVSLGGTAAQANTSDITGLLRYKFDGGFSLIGGVRVQKADASIDLRGIAYGPLNGYSVNLASDTSTGYVVGAAYEKPEIALRVMLTYNSAIEHGFESTETIATPLGTFPLAQSIATVSTPQSVNLDFQTGVAADTLVFGQVRWADWSSFTLSPQYFAGATGGASLIDLPSTTTYTLGIGRKFSEAWSGAFSVTYEGESDPLVSPLAPVNGNIGFTVAGIYTQGNMKITTGINYTQFGNAQAETADVARADFTDNSALGIGVKVGFSF